MNQNMGNNDDITLKYILKLKLKRYVLDISIHEKSGIQELKMYLTTIKSRYSFRTRNE